MSQSAAALLSRRSASVFLDGNNVHSQQGKETQAPGQKAGRKHVVVFFPSSSPSSSVEKLDRLSFQTVCCSQVSG